MGKTLSIVNQKGGVGKTTTSVNLAASMAAAKRRVLLIDMDPQGNATMGSGIDKSGIGKSTYDVLMDLEQLENCVIRSDQLEYEVLPSNSDLTGAEVALLDELAREVRLRNALHPVRDEYDYIFVDCPPSLSMLTVNALVAADSVLIPMQCEYFALEGLTSLLDTIEKIRKHLNPGLTIEGLLRTMYDPRNNLSSEVSEQLVEYFGEKVYRTVIPRNVRLAEAPSHGMSILKYDRSCRGSLAYLALAGEMMRLEGLAA
ncbi:MAG: AAA family ATPase [Thiotrichales bacterium]|nr:AAA family ATPase [Thiotrichales bacterium]